MTLVIAHKIGNHISLSSDSRISFGEGTHPYDYGIKIFSIPVKIFSVTAPKTGEKNLEYDYNFGLAIVGSATNAYTVKESIYEILQNLQYRYSDYSMDTIADLVFIVYKKVTDDLKPILYQNGLCELILAGFCSGQKKVRAFKFSVHPTTIETSYYEILQQDSIEFFGTGKNEAETAFQKFSSAVDSTPFHVIKEVVKNDSVASVGGDIQYGEFDCNNNFKVYGIADYETNEDGSFKRSSYKLRGVDLYQDSFENHKLHISYNFKMPFENERIKLIRSKLNTE